MKLAIRFATAALVLSAAAATQQHTVLLRPGDPLPGYGTLASMYGVGMAEDGTWYLRANGEDATNFYPSLILRNGEVFLEPDQALGNGPATYLRSDMVSADSRGGLIAVGDVEWPGGSQPLPGIIRNGDLILRPDTPVGVPGATPDTTYDYAPSVKAIEPGRLLVYVGLDVPFGNPSHRFGLVDLMVDAHGNIFSEEMIYRTGDLFPGTSQEIVQIPRWTEQYAGNSSGDVIAELRLTNGVHRYVEVIAMNGEILIYSGAPSPVPGSVWDVHFQSAVDINEAGDWVAHARLDDGVTETQCIVKNGEILYQDGQVLDDIAPFALNGYYPGRYLKLTDEGDVIWFGSWGDGGMAQSGLFFNEHLVLGRGSALGSETFGRWSSMGLSSDGSRLGAVVSVEAPTFSGFDVLLLETRFDIASTFCDAVPSSLGRVANTAVMGSPVAFDNDIMLRATNLPDDSYVHFFTSPVQTFVAQPGGSQGNLCLGGAVGRYAGPGQILQAGPSGRVELRVDLNQHPTSLGSVVVRAGETWFFQAWYRDSILGQPVSNFTDAAGVLFE